MKTIDFKTLDDVFDCYGRENLVAIDNIHQILFYCKQGCQPKFVFENEVKPGKITGWFLKSETAFIYNNWKASQPQSK